jgi:hypothetical protein
VPELSSGLAALVADLDNEGFTVDMEEWSPWPGGGHIELAAPASRAGVKRVRMIEDRRAWDVEVNIGRSWYEPFTALLALDGQPHEQWALSHAQRHQATLELVRRFTGERAQVKAIKARHKALAEAYTRWAEGKSESPSPP